MTILHPTSRDLIQIAARCFRVRKHHIGCGRAAVRYLACLICFGLSASALAAQTGTTARNDVDTIQFEESIMAEPPVVPSPKDLPATAPVPSPVATAPAATDQPAACAHRGRDDCQPIHGQCQNRCGRCLREHPCPCRFAGWRASGYVCDDIHCPRYPAPLGQSLHAHMAAQIANGLAAQTTLYLFDFDDVASDTPANLNSRGEQELRRIVQIGTSPATPMPLAPIVIQPSFDQQLDENRRQHVLQRLALWGIPATNELVVVRRPDAHGSSGVEAVLVYLKMLEQTQNQGAAAGGSGTGVGVGAGIPAVGANRRGAAGAGGR